MSDEEQEQTIAEDLVVTKYKMGGDIANRKLMKKLKALSGRNDVPVSACRAASLRQILGFMLMASSPTLLTALLWGSVRRTPSQAEKLMSSKQPICAQKQLYALLNPATRAFEDEAKARLGVVECAKHELLQPFSVLHEKEVLLMANGPHRITNGPFESELYKSEHEVQDPDLKVSLK
ncbi:hypothetical protein GOODEAATRI_020797 [Goodea atripinnis]|uniref:Uncharacterized protein n=1 Tax=Goodea atripinnis TaxID=208336 RepID=A0ABV0NWC5_9TELE